MSKKDYSAYDIIEKILVEAHKTNKDLFGEIINHTAEEDFEPTKVEIVTDGKDEQLSDDEVEKILKFQNMKLQKMQMLSQKQQMNRQKLPKVLLLLTVPMKLQKMKKLILKKLKQISAHIAKKMMCRQKNLMKKILKL